MRLMMATACDRILLEFMLGVTFGLTVSYIYHIAFDLSWFQHRSKSSLVQFNYDLEVFKVFLEE